MRGSRQPLLPGDHFAFDGFLKGIEQQAVVFVIETMGIHIAIDIMVACDKYRTLGVKTPDEFVHGDFVVAEAVVEDVADKNEVVVARLEGGLGDDSVELAGDGPVFLKTLGIAFSFGIHDFGKELEFGFREFHVAAVDGGEDGAAHAAIGIPDNLRAIGDIPGP